MRCTLRSVSLPLTPRHSQLRNPVILRTLCSPSTPTSTRHVIVGNASSPLLSAVVAAELSTSSKHAESLISLGSVYVNERPGTNTPTKRCMQDRPLNEGTYVRVYPSGGRYDVSAVDWRGAIVFDCEDFVVVNKPPGIPCAPTTSNFHENVMESVRRELGCDKLFNPHRLDVATSGVLVYGKNKAFARAFGRAIRLQEVRKTYRLLVVNSFNHEEMQSAETQMIEFPATGSVLKHFMETSRHYPKVLHASEVPESKVCLSVVTAVSRTVSRSCEQLQQLFRHDCNLLGALRCWSVQAARAGHDWLAVCEVELQLVTGRTHQLRAQVLATGKGNAIAGDRVYTPHCSEVLQQHKKNKARGAELNPQDPTLIHSPWLALQACEIEATGESRHVLGGRRHRVAEAFWTPLVAARGAVGCEAAPSNRSSSKFRE